ncbi:helix-turn-helix domain-containing protein [Microbacterium sp. Se63.02b]|uniref:winged helix-turn-helix transcriptional regulator n=1 Tax=Microbacterium sp. Se63.02b TaxID=2709304 RepID=UPI001604BE48|nr:helix-turn-helix domain-containing protein [Microbacterium sp. Se63.02b]QNA93887.1 helix-turn-helix transcriptional regulator [Microbacterium sp. Se63.02b]
MREKTERIIRDWTETCDAEVSIAVLGGAWKPSILTLLGEHEVLRFGELGRLLENPTARVLTRQLRELEEDGLITRTVYREVPPKVEYRLSELGASSGAAADGADPLGHALRRPPACRRASGERRGARERAAEPGDRVITCVVT